MATANRQPRAPSRFSDGFVLGEWTVQPRLNQISRNGDRHRVHGKFMNVLLCLAERGDVLTRQELFDAVWPDTVVVEECLTRAVSELRKALGDDSRRPRYIETIPKKGYRLLVPAVPARDPGRAGAPPAPAAPSKPRRISLAYLAIPLLPLLLVLGNLLGSAGHGSGADTIIEMQQITSLPGRENFPAVSPSGDRVAFVWDGDDSDRSQGLFIKNTAFGEPFRLTPEGTRCAFPAWADNGERIAYARVKVDRTDILEISACGGPEKVLVSGETGTFPIMPDFSPDGRWLAFAALAPGSNGTYSVHLMDLDSGSTRPLADPSPPPVNDFRPRFSPDGSRISFQRTLATGPALAVTSIEGRSPSIIEVGNRRIFDHVWDPTNQDALIFSSTDGLWRVPLSGGPPRLLAAGRGESTHLSVCRTIPLLAVAERAETRDIWRADLAAPTDRSREGAVIASSRLDARPAWSNDGASVAFVSNRTGRFQLWIADRDGGNLRRLTDFEDTLVRGPAWAPDDRSLAFEALLGGQFKICLLDLTSERITVLTPSGPNERAPTWSSKGDFVYFSQQSGNQWRIARRPAAGGSAEILTRGPGFGPVESPDGRAVIYSRLNQGTPELWQVAVDGREEAPLPFSFSGRPVTWTIRPGGIYYCYHRDTRDDTWVVAMRPFGGYDEVALFETTSRSAPSFDVSPDESAILYERAEQSESDIIGLRIS